MSKPAQPVEDRIVEHVEYDAETCCWLWTGPMSSSGYPALKIEGRKELLRPLMYREAFGEPPPSKHTSRPQIRMTCKQKTCICPEHMVVLTDKARELQRLRRQIFLEGFRQFQRDPNNPKLRRLVSAGYIAWKAKTIMAERQQAREAAESPEVQAVIDSVRRKATITGAAPT